MANHARVGVLDLDRQGLALDTGNLETLCADLPDILQAAIRKLRLEEQKPDQVDVARRALMHLYRIAKASLMRFVQLTCRWLSGHRARERSRFGPNLRTSCSAPTTWESPRAGDSYSRCAPPLPPTSAEAQRFGPWHRDEAPRVRLVFQDDTDQYWRIKKMFGDGPRSAAELGASKDGKRTSPPMRKTVECRGPNPKASPGGVSRPRAERARLGGFPRASSRRCCCGSANGKSTTSSGKVSPRTTTTPANSAPK